jgi:hypothetical protein
VTCDRFSTSSAAPPIGVRRFRSFIFGLTCILVGGGFYPGSLKNYITGHPPPRFNPVIMHRTITGILRKTREIEALSTGVETRRGDTLPRPSGCNPTARNHKQSSIFVELADAFSSRTRVCTVFLVTRKSRTLELLAFDEKSTFDFFALFAQIKRGAQHPRGRVNCQNPARAPRGRDA